MFARCCLYGVYAPSSLCLAFWAGVDDGDNDNHCCNGDGDDDGDDGGVCGGSDDDSVGGDDDDGEIGITSVAAPVRNSNCRRESYIGIGLPEKRRSRMRFYW